MTFKRHLLWRGLLALPLFACLLVVGAQEAVERDRPEPPVLQFHTYDDAWLRYKNLDEDGAPVLAGEDLTQFPFAMALSDAPVTKVDGFGSIDELRETYDIDYDEENIVGICDTEKLAGKSSDLFCTPGAESMPPGNVFLVLYQPESHEIAALTTTIDNRNSGASKARAIRERQGAAESESGDSCGPYNPGQWIKAAAYAASGLSLPIQREGVGDPITDYQCVVPAEGAPYLQAWSLSRQGGAEAGDASKSDGGGKGQAKDPDPSGDGDRGGTHTGTDGDLSDLDADGNPCTNSLGCDTGDGDE